MLASPERTSQRTPGTPLAPQELQDGPVAKLVISVTCTARTVRQARRGTLCGRSHASWAQRPYEADIVVLPVDKDTEALVTGLLSSGDRS